MRLVDLIMVVCLAIALACTAYAGATGARWPHTVSVVAIVTSMLVASIADVPRGRRG